MEDQKITTREYYKELHSAARNYNTKLWAIPPLFIVVAGFILERLLKDFYSFQNLIWLVGGLAIGLMLLVQSLKDSYFQILIQKKINELELNDKSGIESEQKTTPLFSATDTEILEGILWLRKLTRQEPVKFLLWKEFLIRRRVSDIFFLAVIIFLVAMVSGLILWIVTFLKSWF